MRGLGSVLAGAVIGAAGLALLLVESLRAIVWDATLGSVAMILLWAGLGLMVLGGLLLVAGALPPRTTENVAAPDRDDAEPVTPQS